MDCHQKCNGVEWNNNWSKESRDQFGHGRRGRGSLKSRTRSPNLIACPKTAKVRGGTNKHKTTGGSEATIPSTLARMKMYPRVVNFILTTATSPSSGGKKQCMTRKTPKSVSDNNERHPKFRVVTFPWPLCRLVSKVKRASTSPMVQTKAVLSCFFMVGRQSPGNFVRKDSIKGSLVEKIPIYERDRRAKNSKVK